MDTALKFDTIAGDYAQLETRIAWQNGRAILEGRAASLKINYFYRMSLQCVRDNRGGLSNRATRRHASQALRRIANEKNTHGW